MSSCIINGRFLTQKLTGVHRYAFEMCTALHESGFKFIVLAPQNVLPEYKFEFEVIKIGKYNSHFWEQIELPLYVHMHFRNALLINFAGLGSLMHSKSICTIHDLSFLENPSWFSKSYYLFYKFLTPLIAHKAKKIITVSEFSKKEISEKLRIDNNKIVVIENAVSPRLLNNFPDNKYNGQRYLLSVSSIDPRKNQLRLIEAFNLLNENNLKLYVVGKKNKVFGKHSLIEQENPNIIFTGYLSDDDLFQIYRNALAFIYPSLYEGFGIPNLEAMSNACPVITSNIAPHKEVCGDSALYFDPESPTDIADKIKRVVEDKALRRELIEKGKLRILHFSWHLSALKLIHVIEII